MIDISILTSNILNILKSDKNIVKEKMAVEYSEYINLDPGNAPWIGFYNKSVKYDPRTLGKHSASWDAEIEIDFLIQASDLESGKNCSDKLNKYIKYVLDALWSDPGFKSSVDMVTGFDINYLYEREQSETIYFQMADITLTLKASS